MMVAASTVPGVTAISSRLVVALMLIVKKWRYQVLAESSSRQREARPPVVLIAALSPAVRARVRVAVVEDQSDPLWSAVLPGM
jgi:hypothetical protein